MGNVGRVFLIAAGASMLIIPAFAQRASDPVTAQYGGCGAANGAGSNATNYYGSGNPCGFTYSVPEQREIQLLNENPQCAMH